MLMLEMLNSIIYLIIKYGFIIGEVVPQTRVNEKPFKVWVCLNLETCQILTGGCGCIAGHTFYITSCFTWS